MLGKQSPYLNVVCGFPEVRFSGRHGTLRNPRGQPSNALPGGGAFASLPHAIPRGEPGSKSESCFCADGKGFCCGLVFSFTKVLTMAQVPRLTWVFRYNDFFHGPKVLGEGRVGATRPQDAHRSHFLHPMLAFFPAGSLNATMRHWLVEDIYTAWGVNEDRAPLAKFLKRVAASVANAIPRA